jgi:1,4-dihydroxy-2-naphthoate octaprenyltransferase
MNSEALSSAPTQAVAPGSLQAWLLASRPATLTAAVAPVLVGTACAFHEGTVRSEAFLATLTGAGCLQIASNFANDVFDHEKGADTDERLGPTRAVQAGLVSARQMKKGLVVALGLALLVGSYLTWLSGWPIVAIGLSSMVAAVAYTGGPYPLGYHGLGDLFVMIFFGFVAVCGTAYVHLGEVPLLAWASALPVGSLITNILVVNNLRDRETDAQVGKRTLAVRFGRRGAEFQYFGLVLLAYAVPVVLWALGRLNLWGLLPLLSAPLALKNVVGVRREEGRALNRLLGASARLVFVFGALFASGIYLSARLSQGG